MTIDSAIKEWKSKNRRMGCVNATDWFCSKVPGFYPERLTRYTESGDLFGHVVATDGLVRIDLSPYADRPRD
jgi:hypothetical protein